MTEASDILEVGALKVPVNFSKRENLVAVAADGVTEHPHAVPVAVSWPVTAEEALGEIEQDSHVINLKVQHELKIPPASNGKKPLQWTPQHSCHLFWAIKRQEKRDDEYNCELMFRDVVPVVAAPIKNGTPWASDAITETFHVRVPYIVNTARILPGHELVLKWQQLVKPDSQKRSRTWVDDVKKVEGRRAKGKN